ncbi:ABC transporter permease [Longimycelium tulufanense]|uniref:ABC transporter permease n=1 Tax=Longimycelium tulufanense TaxID=907463 RepID=A0A8J3C5H5_9PSEU|nr:ABC transporter permease subunit [Longimycelium tulufanense]GGM33023.1 ABC transporter permease [Longimycelium tulufanense]
MGGLIRAEFRKIFTVNLWWGLLIPTVLLGVAWSWMITAGAASFLDTLKQEPVLADVPFDDMMVSVFGFARAANLTTIFPMIFGALAVSTEYHRKTITTTFLTAANRGSTLVAKLVTYSVLGVGLGVLVAASASLGVVLGAGSTPLPGGAGWFLLFLTTVLETALWTLFGVGVGALLSNVFASVIGLIVYVLLIENMLLFFGILPNFENFPSVLPNASASAIPGAVAADLFVDKLGPLVSGRDMEDVRTVLNAVAGAPGAMPWWANTLIFLGYTVVVLGLGWVASTKRDIT